MPAPRMRVAVLGTSEAGMQLAQAMEQSGHTIVAVADPAAIAKSQALILAVDAADLERVIALVAPHIRRGHIVIHTALSVGVQALDDLETRGAVVAAIAPLGPDRYVTSTLDELGETIAGLIVGETGAVSIALTDAERGPIAVRVNYARMLAELAADAQAEVERFSGYPAAGAMDPREVMAALEFAREPGLRRIYIDLARRLGEIRQDTELEVWSMQEENR